MDQFALHQYWPQANQRLVAKLISELAYEQAFLLNPVQKSFVLSLKNGIEYRFTGLRNIWGQIVIDATSLVRIADDANSEITAAQFMLDIKTELDMSDEALAEHFEDMNATLLGDCKLAVFKQDLSAYDLANMSCEQQQNLFNGHPKFAFNKGRRGWGSDDLHQFAPEAQQSFQLCWLAVDNEIIQQATTAEVDWQSLLLTALGSQTLDQLKNRLVNCGVEPNRYTLIPAHPWQWQKKISLLYVQELATKRLIYLGEHGDKFSPQLSLRTLTNTTRPEGYDIKLPLTIMNTSCYRGIPGRYILAGPIASQWIDQIFKHDPLLIAKGAEILQEPAAAFVAQQDYSALTQAPYRYHELLGVIWREPIHNKLKSNEKAILMAALMESDNAGNPLIAEYINASSLNAEQWLTQLFDVVVIPFYHLLVKYGVSLIAHGQNITLVLENNAPKRILLKDFQGDMRLVDKDLPEQDSLDETVKKVTVRLPEELIIHDLQTGHFVTVLRFISPLVEGSLGITESTFYALLANTLQRYIAQHPELKERFECLNLFHPRILRIGLNLAKFRHRTDASVSRMLPDIDDMLDNPLYLAMQK